MPTDASQGTASPLGALERFLKHHPFLQHLVIAYSGGCDSHSLLHAFSVLRDRAASSREHFPRLTAVYIDHGLQAESRQWWQHCESVSMALGIDFQGMTVDARPQRGQSPEACARELRYKALAKCLNPGLECLVTAQHADDQAETVLLQLLRGSGPRGLAAMPALAPFAGAWHARPWLELGQQGIHDYAREQGLQWIEDPSNQQDHYDRNYLRNRVIPALKQRWPPLDQTLSRSARWQAESLVILDEVARSDRQQCEAETANTLSIPELNALGRERQANLIRYWLSELRLDPPGAQVMEQIRQQLLSTSWATEQRTRNRPDSLVAWSDTELRRYRDTLQAEEKRPPFDASRTVQWHIDEQYPERSAPLILPDSNGTLSLQTASHGLRVSQLAGRSLEVSYRGSEGGYSLRIRGKTRSLKSLYQEAAVLPWQRSRIPLLGVDGELVAIAGLWLADEWRHASREDSPVWWPHWQHDYIDKK